MKTWLVIDCNFMCYRSFFTTGRLSFEGISTGVTYGFLRDLRNLESDHAVDKTILAFDHGKGAREKLYPWYKSERRAKKSDREQLAALDEMRSQVDKLKRIYLPSIGYKNVYYQDGYEADDIIAVVCKSLPKKTQAIIISADKDLFQLLTRNVSMINPITKFKYTVDWFRKTYNITPEEWVFVKTIAGCKTDSVEGVHGVGEKTAAAYLSGDLKGSSKKYAAIRAFTKTSKSAENLTVVRLPFKHRGVPPILLEEPRKNKFKPKAWKRLVDKLGMKSLEESARGTTL